VCKQESAREKLNRKGAEALNDAELLQAIIGSGGHDNGLNQIAKNLNAVIQRIGHEYITVDDMMSVKGVGIAKAAALLAAMEFYRRKHTKQSATLVDSPESAADQFRHISGKKQEHFVMLTLDGGRRLINSRTITIGTLMSSLVHPREVFAPAIEDRAASIIIGHNHPSGMLDVSIQDREVSKRISQAGELLGIRLDDHLVVAENDSGFAFVSAI